MEGEGAINAWDEASEAAFLSDQREQGIAAPPPEPKPAAEEETDSKALPALKDLVDRIPAETRQLMDELFRARFVTVRRLPKKALKDPPAA